MELVLLYTPVSSLEAGRKIAKRLLEERLTVCVNLIPRIASLFLWKGKLQETEEALMVVKTLSSLREQTTRRIQALHSYETPVILEIPVAYAPEEIGLWAHESLCSPSPLS